MFVHYYKNIIFLIIILLYQGLSDVEVISCIEQISGFLYGRDKKWPDQKLIKSYPEMLSFLNAEEKDLELSCGVNRKWLV